MARAADARDVLVDALRERGAEVDVVALYETVAEPLSDVQLAAVKLTYHDPVNGDLVQELKFNKSAALQQIWNVPQYAANSPRQYDVDVRYFAYDRTKTSEQHLKDVKDDTFYLDRSAARPPA